MMHTNNKRRTPSSFYGTQWPPVPPRYNNTPSKVVSIPVHFVDSSERSSSRKNESLSSKKIQSVVRGFLVKKSVKKMMAIKVELEEIETKVNAPETIELMKREQKERIRIGETIMNLLLRLDSVRVFHCSALRDLRKSLIKRAIVLQEFVDQIQTVGPTITPSHQSQSTQAECLEKEKHEGGNKMEALVNEEKNEDGEGKYVEEEIFFAKENEGEDEGEEQEGGIKMEAEEGGEGMRGESLVEEKGNFLVKEKEGKDENLEHEGGNKIEASMIEEKEEDGEGKCEWGESLITEKEGKDEEGEKMEGLGKGEKMEDSEGGRVLVEEDYVEKEEDGYEEEEEESYEGGRADGENREMLKKMVEDNQKMMDMMAQLFERNEMQTRMLTSLTQRVEQLERAFTWDKLRRKKQKRRNLDAKFNRQIDPKNSCT